MHLKAQIDHPQQVRQAEPLHLRELEHCVAALQVEAASPDLVVRLRLATPGFLAGLSQ
jgi:hypothetical protein